MQHIAAPMAAITLSSNCGLETHRSCHHHSIQSDRQPWHAGKSRLEHRFVRKWTQYGKICWRTKMGIVLGQGHLEDGQHVHTIAIGTTRLQVLNHPLVIPLFSNGGRLATLLRSRHTHLTSKGCSACLHLQRDFCWPFNL